MGLVQVADGDIGSSGPLGGATLGAPQLVLRDLALVRRMWCCIMGRLLKNVGWLTTCDFE